MVLLRGETTQTCNRFEKKSVCLFIYVLNSWCLQGNLKQTRFFHTICECVEVWLSHTVLSKYLSTQ